MSKNFDDWADELESLAATYRHASNLRTQLTTVKPTRTAWRGALESIAPAYLDLVAHFSVADESVSLWLDRVMDPLNDYLELLYTRAHNVVSHQSDFVSSLIPEFLQRLFLRILSEYQNDMVVNSQSDIIIECMFSPRGGGLFLPKRKRVDVSISLPARLEFRDLIVPNFGIPIVAIEAKTNLDKNMLAGIGHSVERLKSTFPKCLYFVVTELADFEFEKQNYASSGIDEIVVFRKQKRAQVRSGTARNRLEKAEFEYLVTSVRTAVEASSAATPELSSRMTGGRLVEGAR
jgi:hypothetical protein